jgi:hypothetical protein
MDAQALEGAFTWYPPDPALDRWREMYSAAARSNSGEPDARRRLLAWAHAAGAERLRRHLYVVLCGPGFACGVGSDVGRSPARVLHEFGAATPFRLRRGSGQLRLRHSQCRYPAGREDELAARRGGVDLFLQTTKGPTSSRRSQTGQLPWIVDSVFEKVGPAPTHLLLNARRRVTHDNQPLAH